jgi:hypothetical protein
MPFNAFNSVARFKKTGGGVQPIRWVAVGNGTSEIVKSTNGTSYTRASAAGTLFSTQGYGIAYGNGTWVAGGDGISNTLAYSNDGNTWTGLGKSIIGVGVFDIKYANGIFVAGGQGGATTGANTIATSPDGIIWTGRGKNIITSGVEKITYGNGIWVVGGSGGNTIATSSTNGNSWVGQNNTFMSYIGALTYGDGKFVAFGVGGNFIATSGNGFSWSAQTSTNINFGNPNYLEYANGVFVVVTYGKTSNTIATSTDGITWTGRGKQFFNDSAGECVAYGKDDTGNPLWVAVGSPGTTIPANTFATSSDNGVTWVGRGTNFITGTARRIAYNTSLG